MREPKRFLVASVGGPDRQVLDSQWLTRQNGRATAVAFGCIWLHLVAFGCIWMHGVAASRNQDVVVSRVRAPGVLVAWYLVLEKRPRRHVREWGYSVLKELAGVSAAGGDRKK